MTVTTKDDSPLSQEIRRIEEKSYGATKNKSESEDLVEPTSTDSYWSRFQMPEATAYPVKDNGDEETGDVVLVTAKIDDREIRHGFIRKVYSILSAQIMLTLGICAFVTLHTSTREYVLQSDWLFWTTMILTFVLLFTLQRYKKIYPINMVLLTLWTFSISYQIGIVTALYAETGQSWTIVEALFLTGVVFFVLTLYTLQSKRDFSFMEAGLGMGLLVLILWSFLGLIFGFTMGYVYALGGTVLFSGFIIYDTWMVTERLDPDDYIEAAIELYLDIVNLFLSILQLLSKDN